MCYWGEAFFRTKNVSHMGRRFCVSKNLPLGGRWPEGPEGESLAFARNLRACVKLSPPPPAGGAPSQRGPRSFSTSCWKCAVFNTENVIFTEFLLCSGVLAAAGPLNMASAAGLFQVSCNKRHNALKEGHDGAVVVVGAALSFSAAKGVLSPAGSF